MKASIQETVLNEVSGVLNDNIKDISKLLSGSSKNLGGYIRGMVPMPKTSINLVGLYDLATKVEELCRNLNRKSFRTRTVFRNIGIRELPMFTRALDSMRNEDSYVDELRQEFADNLAEVVARVLDLEKVTPPREKWYKPSRYTPEELEEYRRMRQEEEYPEIVNSLMSYLSSLKKVIEALLRIQKDQEREQLKQEEAK